MELGCSTLLFGGFSLDEALDGIKQVGYRAIELCSIPGMAEHLNPDGDDAYYREVADKVAERGLEIESIGGSTNLLDDASRARFVKLMQSGQKIGAPAITTGSGGRSDDEESFKRVVRIINELTHVARDTGVRISIKPHVRAAVYNTETALRFMDEVDNEWVGINYDASHIWRTPQREDPVESLKSLAPYIVTARIRDTLSHELQIGPPETQVPGKGAMPLPDIINALKQVPQLRYMTLEIVGTRQFPYTEVMRIITESKAYLAQYL